MYYQNYEDYMRSVLGYPNVPRNDYEDDYYQVQMSVVPEEREEWYPEIYRMIYPMVCKACDEVQGREITEDLIEELTNNIYINFEVEEVPEPKVQNRNGDVRNPNAKEEVRETRQSNPLLRDLIRILLLQRLWNRPPRPRPPRPRPPMPGPRPPFPGGLRPPMPRGYEDLYY